MSDAIDIGMLLSCANCGKGEEDSNKLKKCSACLSVKYCSAACQKAHRPQHKKACKKKAAELYEEKLFKEVEREECPICFLPLSGREMTEMFQSCCGKVICIGCIYLMNESGGKDLCAFCRTPPPSSDEERIKRLKKLMAKGVGGAFFSLAGYYDRGMMGLTQDWAKSNELLLRGGELGYSEAYYNLACSYSNGTGVEVDTNKAKYYYELAAMNGSIKARHNLGCIEGQAGHFCRGMKHLILAARAGYEMSLEAVKKGYMSGLGLLTKDEYANTLRAYQKRQKEMKSDARDKAAVSGIFSH